MVDRVYDSTSHVDSTTSDLVYLHDVHNKNNSRDISRKTK